MSFEESAELSCRSPRQNNCWAGNVLAILAFVLAGGILLCLEHWAWRYSIEPHVGLVKRIAVPAVVLSHRVDERGTGPQGSIFPHVTYRYSVGGCEYESSVIRPQEYVNEEGEIGESRFDGPNRHQLAQSLLDQFAIGQIVTAWVDLKDPSDAMLVQQQPSFMPFLWGLLPVLFIPILWIMAVGVLRIAFQRPRGRWLAMGWSILTLAGAIPIVWQYKDLLADRDSSILCRLLNVGLGIAAVSLVGSLFPRAIRSGLAIGSILCFSVFGGIGTVLAVALSQSSGLFGWNANPANVFVSCMELALLSGTSLGLLIAIGASRGFIWIRTDDDN